MEKWSPNTPPNKVKVAAPCCWTRTWPASDVGCTVARGCAFGSLLNPKLAASAYLPAPSDIAHIARNASKKKRIHEEYRRSCRQKHYHAGR